MFLKDLIKKTVSFLGYQIKRDNIKIKDSQNYSRVYPAATFSPWLQDKSFNHVYDLIGNNTMIDKYRCYELWKLVEESMKFKGSLIEIGVWKGGSTGLIAYKTALIDETRKVYSCDTFKGVVKNSEKDSVYKGGEHKDTSKQLVEDFISEKLGLKNVILIEGVFPDDVEHLFNNEKFSFCHIDVDVYKSAKDIMRWIWDKLSVGCIIVYDDYGFEECDGITKFIGEERLLNDRIVIHNLNGHAIVIKIK